MADVPAADFQQGGGTPEQLPQGGAQQLNQAVAAVPDQQAPVDFTTAPELQPAGASDFTPNYQPDTPDSQFVTGPTTRPDEAQSVGGTPTPSLSPEIASQLPALQAAADAPNASAELKALVSYLIRLS